jgi:GTP-binding protein HflX
VVIVVIDVSDSEMELRKKYRSCLKTLSDLDVDQERVIYALNKSDLIGPEEILQRAESIGLGDSRKWVPISSVTGQNIQKLQELINAMIQRPRPQIKEIPRKQDLAKFYDENED